MKGSVKVSLEIKSANVSLENNFAFQLPWQEMSSTSLCDDYSTLPNDPALKGGNKNE